MYDIIVIGAGVVGCAIARELAKYKAAVCVLEHFEDVCCGTSKANSAIMHAGFDAENGTLKAKLNVEGNAMMDALSDELDIPFKRNGSLVLCLDENRIGELEALKSRGEINGVPGLAILTGDEARAKEPNLSEAVVAALWAPTGGIVCPFEMTIAYAENAAVNGVTFEFEKTVTSVSKTGQGTFLIETEDGSVYESRAVVNAAGVLADVIHNMVCEDKLHIIARKGEYCLMDKTVGDHVSSTIFQLPTPMGKGVLVTPTIHGNLLVGPTAVDVEDPDSTNTTSAGLSVLLTQGGQSVKGLPTRQIITSFAGLRAHEDGNEFIVGASSVPGFFDAAGIESPGLTSAPAIGVMVAEQAAAALGLEINPDFTGTRKGIPRVHELPFEERAALIRENPAYGHIICRCEMVSEGEILDAIRRPLGARSLDGVKRRTRAGMGRCQSGFCSPRTMELLRREVPMAMEAVTKSGGASRIVIGKTKDAALMMNSDVSEKGGDPV